MSSLQALPKYKTPPVIEVVCGVQFEPLQNFLSVHYGEFWQRIKKDYIKTEDNPPLGDLQETAQGTQAKADILANIPPHRRVFYIDQSGNFLLQVQPSRFLANWRKQRPENEYPSYAVAFDRFLKGWNDFLAFVREANLSAPRTNQYELTYINHIREGEHRYPVGIEDHFPLFSWRSAQSAKFLPEPRSATLRFQFALPDSKGRLHVTITHGILIEEKREVLVVDLTARGPAKPDWSDMEEWFSVAHEWIVRGFTDLTSPAAHQQWERER